MTRETKIGLLVGLAFIIVIGVLLSDHLVNATDVKMASLNEVARDVQKGLQVPGGADSGNAPIVKPGDVNPNTAIPTGRELARVENAGTAQVQITPAPIEVASAVNPTVVTPVIPKDGGSVVSLAPAGTTTSDTATAGNDHAPAPTIPGATAVVPTPEKLLPTPETDSSKGTEYKAVAGDTVAKMAKKFYGADTNANRQRIIGANAALKANPRKIVIGNTYIIPAKEGSDTTHSTVASEQTTAPSVAPVADTGSAGERIYTVKQGDNLWKIAKQQCKNANAADEILKLNRDVLKNGTALKVGMKIKLPTK